MSDSNVTQAIIFKLKIIKWKHGHIKFVIGIYHFDTNCKKQNHKLSFINQRLTTTSLFLLIGVHNNWRCIWHRTMSVISRIKGYIYFYSINHCISISCFFGLSRLGIENVQDILLLEFLKIESIFGLPR